MFSTAIQAKVGSRVKLQPAHPWFGCFRTGAATGFDVSVGKNPSPGHAR